MKSELQNAVDRLRQKLHDVEIHAQDKQNKFTVDKQQWESQRVELTGKINEVRFLCRQKLLSMHSILVRRTVIQSKQTTTKRFGS